MVHQIDTIHWFTGFDYPRSVVASGGIYQWQDGRTNPDTMTAVFDYGPANDNKKGFQVVYSSRMGNSAGGTKELYTLSAKLATQLAAQVIGRELSPQDHQRLISDAIDGIDGAGRN